MMMKPVPVPAFEMLQTKFPLQFFVVVLDAPAQFCDSNQLAQRNQHGQMLTANFSLAPSLLHPF